MTIDECFQKVKAEMLYSVGERMDAEKLTEALGISSDRFEEIYKECTDPLLNFSSTRNVSKAADLLSILKKCNNLQEFTLAVDIYSVVLSKIKKDPIFLLSNLLKLLKGA